LVLFSYARANKHDYLESFYNDLWDVLKQKLTVTEQQRHVPFSDWKKLQLASRWAVQLDSPPYRAERQGPLRYHERLGGLLTYDAQEAA
jgi:hypothetical protein